ncbi:carbamoyltransferase HypF [Propionivibrio limicola]|uniref:Kae1-like domain-containing protein n=1 Tax=Propionivibrio limicola TaxID=167645 RepID=UPI0012926EF1|nr:carbamoyltransferase HypF [Propionivibrio limicola]
MSVTVIDLPIAAPGVLALGAWLKSSVCAVRGNTAFVSETIGDLVDAGACEALERTVGQLCAEQRIEPAIVAHDLHPDFFSTRLALQIAERCGMPALGVQHHHAHIAAVCAEHGVSGPVLGLAMDGVGLGSDGQAWGGELLRLDGACFQRLGHLQPLRLPGGDRAARETWRMAASALASLDRPHEIAARFADQPAAPTVAAMLERDFNCPPTTSLGRLFDAAAGLLGLCPVQSFEGEAAMALQALAERHGKVVALADGYALGETLDFRPLLAVLAGDVDIGYGAALFHATLAAGLADWVAEAAERQGIRRVACGGGCFLNRLLVQRLFGLLRERGIEMQTARRLSPGDSALSLGQAWVAVQHLQER